MIRRVSDFSNLSNDDFEKLAETIKNKENKKLYKSCSDEKEVKIAMKEVKLHGYNVEVDKIGESYNVYNILPEIVDLTTAQDSGNFKKLAWGRYSFQKVNSIGGFEHYNYDDGSIWKTITKEDGKEYLVKEVEDEDDDKIIRNASLKKKASISVTDANFEVAMQILYHNSSTPNTQFINDLLTNQSVKTELYSMLEKRIHDIVSEKLQNQNLKDDAKIEKIINVIEENINNHQIVDENTMESVIYNYIQELMLDGAFSVEQYD